MLTPRAKYIIKESKTSVYNVHFLQRKSIIQSNVELKQVNPTLCTLCTNNPLYPDEDKKNILLKDLLIKKIKKIKRPAH